MSEGLSKIFVSAFLATSKASGPDVWSEVEADLPKKSRGMGGSRQDTIPMGRDGRLEEVARAILRLASAEAAFITGTFLDVTGGK
jgi:NAD(P)-dependent dehydrogenase (short-subunit alcohol dehydrogenase family)